MQEYLLRLDQYALLQLALRIGGAILVFLVGRWLARRTRNTLRATLVKTTLAPSMTRLLLLAVYYGILFLTVVLALALVGFPITALLSASLIVVVILGIALQQSISNLAATIVFMLFQPFRVGELIEANGVLAPSRRSSSSARCWSRATTRRSRFPTARSRATTWSTIPARAGCAWTSRSM